MSDRVKLLFNILDSFKAAQNESIRQLMSFFKYILNEKISIEFYQTFNNVDLNPSWSGEGLLFISESEAEGNRCIQIPFAAEFHYNANGITTVGVLRKISIDSEIKHIPVTYDFSELSNDMFAIIQNWVENNKHKL